MLYSVVICPVSVLECSYNADGACLLEISCNELCSLSPCCDVDEVCLRLLTVTSAKATVYRDCEGCYGNSGGCCLELGIRCESAADDYLIEVEISHFFFSLSIRFRQLINRFLLQSRDRPLRFCNPSDYLSS
jgi:hypothetical protein